MKRAISVIGSSEPTAEERDLAYRVGALIAKEGFVLVCGGLGGVMEAACRGAKSAGGLTVGILPGREKSSANPYVDLAIPTAMSEARNAVVVLSGEAAVAVGGGFGTLSEIALALRAGKTVVSLASWRLEEEKAQGASLLRAETPEEAIQAVLSALRR